MKRTLVCVGVLLVALPALGQSPSSSRPDDSPARMRLRYQIRIMEGVLERAVQHGAEVIGVQLRSISPDIVVFSGPARARGFKLDNYGVFFDVEVPALRRSVTWTFRTLQQQNLGLDTAIQSLRRHVESVADTAARRDLEQALKLVELQVTPGSMPDDPQATSPDDAVTRDPNEAYTSEVKQALIDAMLDHTGPISIGSDEWLTVAAQDGESRLAPGDLSDTFTILLRVKGGDLQAYRGGKLTREEAIRRIEVQAF